MEEKITKLKEATCEIEVTFEVIGGKWKPLILWYLGEINTLRFGQLKHLIPDITHKILTKQLRDLEENGLIERKVYPEIPPKVEYSITENGKEVLPILEMMCDWAYKNNYFNYDLKYDLCGENIKNTLSLYANDI
ncbi:MULTISPECIES: winged helix-turn-helix transcriptional regulator [Clostridium]|uniref:winged helix-turn-helix transcriptional regulator n=1 Tax=Clostridium TaxID=1485 RepID=UPI001A9C69DF|nr:MULTISPECIES: helix-turn-helix domain-containing protein [Clostridium]MDD7792834.1 helix-turn-helix domain-containing protein [Clostridium sp. 'White wine YQ']